MKFGREEGTLGASVFPKDKERLVDERGRIKRGEGGLEAADRWERERKKVHARDGASFSSLSYVSLRDGREVNEVTMQEKRDAPSPTPGILGKVGPSAPGVLAVRSELGFVS